MNNPKIEIQLFALQGLISQQGISPDIVKAIKKAGLEAWQQKEPNAQSVRFLCQIPGQNQHFRFFYINQKENGNLFISW